MAGSLVRPDLEQLTARVNPSSVTLQPSGPYILYQAAPGESNDVRISQSGGTITIVDAGGIAIEHSAPFQGSGLPGDPVTLTGITVSKIQVYLNDQADRAEMLGTIAIRAEMWGEAGMDDLYGGYGGDYLDGGDLRDRLFGGS